MPTDPERAALAALDEMESLAGLAGYSQRYEDLLYNHAPALFSLARRAETLEKAVVWALGYTSFPARPRGGPPYWWRKELRERAGLSGPRCQEIAEALAASGGGEG